MNRIIWLFFFLWFLNAGLPAQNFSGGFGFNLPELDSSTQRFMPEFPAFTIDESHRVLANGDHFEAAGAPIRFWGVNITAAACFPPKNKAAAIAGRMRKMGINLVRFHHLENNWSGDDGSIFIYANGTRSLNIQTLDRLNYFIAQLKQNGIYVNMNLNVSRIFRPSDGVPGADSLPDFAKGVTLFDPWLQSLQREYALQLLTSVNPYTGMSLASDPVLAMVEMNNENSLYGWWKEDRLKPFSAGGTLMHRHAVLMDSLWNAYLSDKYASNAELANAWNVGVSVPGTGELLLNTGFESGQIAWPWSLEIHDQAVATVNAVTENPNSGAWCARLRVNEVTGTDWHIQFKQSGFSVQKDSIYALRFRARADADKPFSVSIMRDNAPYNWYGGAQLLATTAWQTFEVAFVADEDNQNFGRVSISPLQSTGDLYFDDFSLAKPGINGLEAGENLGNGTVRRIDWSRRHQYTDPRVADMAGFYIGLQKRHFDELRAYLRNELGVAAAITGTNALVGPADAAEHEDLDYLDDHSYWDHPWFPNGAWDPYDWQIGNQPMLRDPGFSAMAAAFSGLNFEGKPFTVSEYNHAAPNRFRVEMPPAMAAYASLHGADGIMFFEYNGDYTWEPDVLDGFFSLNRDNSVMALFPSCAAAYRNTFIAADPNPLVVQYTEEELYDLAKSDNQGRWSRFVPYPLSLNLEHAVKTGSYRANAGSDFTQLPDPGGSPYTTSGGETMLDTDRGLIQTATEWYCAIAGFLPEASNSVVGAMQLVSATDFGAITWVSITGESLNQANRSLLTVSTVQQNTGMLWDGVTTVHSSWGQAPTLQKPMLLQVQLNIEADSIRVYPLDNKGKENAYYTLLPVAANVFVLTVDQSVDKTLWYGLEAYRGLVSVPDATKTAYTCSLSPNPLGEASFVRVQVEAPEAANITIWVYDTQGKKVWDMSPQFCPAGKNTFTIHASGWASGAYQLVVQANQWVERRVLIR